MRINKIETNIYKTKPIIQPSFKAIKVKNQEHFIEEILKLGGMMGILGLSQVVNKPNTKPVEPKNGYLNLKPSSNDVQNSNILRDFIKIETDNISLSETKKIIAKMSEVPVATTSGFLKAVFDFKNSTPSHPKFSESFYFLRNDNIKNFVDTVIINNAEFIDEEANITPRFSIEEMVELGQLFWTSDNKELVLDLIKDSVTNKYYDDIKIYRFNKEEIEIITELYHETPYKQLLLDVLAKYESIPKQNKKTGEFNLEQISELVCNCDTESEAEFLSKILTKKSPDKYGNIIETYSGEEIFILRALYNDYPKDVDFLVSQNKKINNKNVPRFNVKEISNILRAKNNIGDTVFDIISENKDMDNTTLTNLISELESSNNRALKNKYLKKHKKTKKVC